MERLFLTVACGDYDRTKALQDGTVQPEGIRLNYIPMQSEEIFWRMTSHLEFDASEMSLANYVILLSRGQAPFVAIPVFPSRLFRHGCIFVHADSGIRRPEDLKGKRVGTPEYAMTATVWIRGFLKDDYGVGPEDVLWLTGGQETPGRKERVELRLPPGVEVRPIPENRTLNDMLERGEIDALISARIPAAILRGSPKVRRLFPDYREVEADYYRRTGIFPIMHVVVIRKDVYERHPWTAASLFKAFEEAKERAFQRMRITNAPVYMLPWLFAEVESLRELFGPDWWPYGIEPNRGTLETLVRYLAEQGLIERTLKIEEIFAPSTAGEFKI